MHHFKTVKDLIEELQKLPQDAECHIGNWESFLDDDLKRLNPIRITDKESYQIYPLDNVEFKTVYTWSTRSGSRYETVTCVVFSTG